ncbi:MAG TPA: SAM-dependent methyltransferase [Burkholderiales bacterium]|nr:SAM-dependent methyltransferase [Burkholderiales bacterium]
MSRPGTLYLVPTGLGGDVREVLPESTMNRLRMLRSFIVENAKSARQFLKSAGYPHPLQKVRMQTLDEHTPDAMLPELLAPVLAGEDCGLLSEAGCPAVADPGALLVRLAHAQGVRVIPLVGPSAVLLALMASGLNGQRFAFHGYLPVDAEQRRKTVKELESDSGRNDRTQIFIETPYRNNATFRGLLDACRDDTLICVATDISTSTEAIRTCPVKTWRKAPPELHRRPTVFLLYAFQKR